MEGYREGRSLGVRDFLPVRALTPVGSYCLFPEAWEDPWGTGEENPKTTPADM